MSTRAYKWTSNDGWRVRVVPGADIATLRLKMSHTTRGGHALFLVEIDDLDAAAIRGLKIAVPRGERAPRHYEFDRALSGSISEPSDMNLPRRQFFHVAAGAAALPVMSQIARAQTYPSRPVTMIVPYPAGGPTDTIARLLGERMRASLGQPVVIENVAGAGGNIGVGRVARAAGDGYTLGIGHWGSHVVNGAIYTLPYDLLTDLEPVALISDGPQLIVAAKSVPAKNIQELIAWLKANPGKAMVGTTGVGGASHLAGILFQNSTGTNIQIVPYRGAAPRMQDMLSGQIHLAFDQAASSLPQVQGGNLQAYAVTSKTRLTVAPDIPTVDEAGLPGFYISVWHGLWASKGTPKDAVRRLNAAAVEALADPTVRQRLTELGQELPARAQQTPEALAAYQKAEIEKWWPIIKAANIKVE